MSLSPPVTTGGPPPAGDIHEAPGSMKEVKSFTQSSRRKYTETTEKSKMFSVHSARERADDSISEKLRGLCVKRPYFLRSGLGGVRRRRL